MDMFENGILTLKGHRWDVSDFGIPKQWLSWCARHACGKGFGDLSSRQGPIGFAESFGHPEYSMTVKKQETARL